MPAGMTIILFGSVRASPADDVPKYFNGLMRALRDRGHRPIFYCTDRDTGGDPGLWAPIGSGRSAILRALEGVAGADMIVQVGADGNLGDPFAAAVLDMKTRDNLVVFWDPDPASMLERMSAEPDDRFLALLPSYDLVLTRGGGGRILAAYREFGVVDCLPVDEAVDTAVHYPVPLDSRFAADLAFHGRCLPEIEHRMQELFFNAAVQLPHSSFMLAGADWSGRTIPPNVLYLGELEQHDRNALNSSSLAVLTVSTERALHLQVCPMQQMLEAASCGACVVADTWEGLERFLDLEREVLPASDALEVANWLHWLTRERARAIGTAARRRVLASHTYAHRIEQLERYIGAAAQG